MENEVFTEAVPTTLIMTFLMIVLVFNVTLDDGRGSILVGDDGVGAILFSVTFATSALSAGLGLAKCLKVSAYTLQPPDLQTILTRKFQFHI